jgi:hypothetical protein
MNKIDIMELPSKIGNDMDLFVCSASFEDRCLTVAKALKNKVQFSKSLLFFSSTSELSKKNKTTLNELLSEGDVIETQLSVSSPQLTASNIARSMNECIGDGYCKVLLDATTFTHEQLLIIIKFLSYLQGNRLNKIDLTITYSGATTYGVNLEDPEDFWLSRGIREIRPVIGFSGRFRTGQATQLILLVGFEHERARAAIEYVEPGILTLGAGRKNDSISAALADTNQRFYEKLSTFIENVSHTFSDVNKFEVSVIDSMTARDELLRVANPDSNNVIICPMNTKISTIGAALAALRDPRIQLMYVEPLEYNELGYSQSDTDIRYGKISLSAV